MTDVIVVGAGPAGALAATLLARAGVRVTAFERARFPRHKLCGDTLNPGALELLSQCIPVESIIASSRPLDGMLLTGPGGVRVTGRYGNGRQGRSIPRALLDTCLLEHAVSAGVSVEEGTRVVAPVVDGDRISGVMVKTPQGVRTERARLVIAADGRESALARRLTLARFASRPRRWAIGAYFERVGGLASVGEMHVRHGHYIGVAPMPDGRANTCLVLPRWHGGAGSSPAAMLHDALSRDAALAARFADARLTGPPVVLGPMAVDSGTAGVPGLLLAGDAAGFIDPMTGDGLRLALDGARLAAATALEVLSGTVAAEDAPLTLARQRHARFAAKWRFNRALRALVASPHAVNAAALGARVLPSLFEQVIRYAGDCHEIESSKFKVQSSKFKSAECRVQR